MEEKIVTFETATHVLTQSLVNYLNSYPDEIYFSSVGLNIYAKEDIERVIEDLRLISTLD